MKKTILSLGCAMIALFATSPSNAQFSLSVGINVTTAPPPLPVYTQPPCPVDGYLWSPGYWAWDDVDGYYWVPGVWVMPPQPGYLWTPGYWGYAGGFYGWHSGYWGPHVGFYGGVNYGYGYGGSGFYGGRWEGGHYRYNTAVVQVNETVVHNTYVDRTVINNTVINNKTVNNRVSYNGGAGIQARPTTEQQQAMHETHVQPTSVQVAHNQGAAKDRNQFASVNKGRPQTVAMDKPGGGRFNGQGKMASAPTPGTAAPMPNNNHGPANKPSTANTNGVVKPQITRPNNPLPQNANRDQHVAQQQNIPQHPQNTTQHPQREATQPQTIRPNNPAQQNANRDQHVAQRQSMPQHPQNMVQHPQREVVQRPPQQPRPMPRNNPPHAERPEGGGHH